MAEPAWIQARNIVTLAFAILVGMHVASADRLQLMKKQGVTLSGRPAPPTAKRPISLCLITRYGVFAGRNGIPAIHFFVLQASRRIEPNCRQIDHKCLMASWLQFSAAVSMSLLTVKVWAKRRKINILNKRFSLVLTVSDAIITVKVLEIMDGRIISWADADTG